MRKYYSGEILFCGVLGCYIQLNKFTLLYARFNWSIFVVVKMWSRVALYKNTCQRYQWFNLRLLLEAISTTRLKLRMCHGCVYTSSFAGNRLSGTLLAALLVHRIEIPYQAFPERVGPRIPSYRKRWLTLVQVITSVVEKTNNLNKQKIRGLLENQNLGSMIEARLKKNENKLNK